MPRQETVTTGDDDDTPTCSPGPDTHQYAEHRNRIDPTLPNSAHVSTMSAVVDALLDCPLARSRTYEVLQSLYNSYEGTMVDGRTTEEQHAHECSMNDLDCEPFAVAGLVYYHFSPTVTGHLPEREQFVRIAIGKCVATYKETIKNVCQVVYDLFVARGTEHTIISDDAAVDVSDHYRSVSMVSFYAEVITGLWHFGLAPFPFFHSVLTFLSGDMLKVLGPTDPVHNVPGRGPESPTEPYDRVELRVGILHWAGVKRNEADFVRLRGRIHCFGATVAKLVFMGLPRMSKGNLKQKELVKVWFFYFEGLYRLLSTNTSHKERATNSGLADLATRSNLQVAHSFAARIIGSEYPTEQYDAARFFLTTTKVASVSRLLWDLATFCENADDLFDVARLALLKGANAHQQMRVAAAKVRSGKRSSMGYPFAPEQSKTVVTVMNALDRLVNARCPSWDCVFVAEATISIITNLPEDLVQAYSFRLIELFAILQCVNNNVALWKAVCGVAKFHIFLLAEDFRALGTAGTRDSPKCKYAKDSPQWCCRQLALREICILVPLVGDGGPHDCKEAPHAPTISNLGLNKERYDFFLCAYKAILACFCAGDMRQLLDTYDVFVVALCTLVWRSCADPDSKQREEMRTKLRHGIGPVFADTIMWLEKEPKRLARTESRFALFVAYDPVFMADSALMCYPEWLHAIYAPRLADYREAGISPPLNTRAHEAATAVAIDRCLKRAPPTSGKKARSQERAKTRLQNHPLFGRSTVRAAAIADRAAAIADEACKGADETFKQCQAQDIHGDKVEAGKGPPVCAVEEELVLVPEPTTQATADARKASESSKGDVYDAQGCLIRRCWFNGRVNFYTGPKGHERRFETLWPGGFRSLYHHGPVGSEYRYRTLPPSARKGGGAKNGECCTGVVCINHGKPFGDDSCLTLESSSGVRDYFTGHGKGLTLRRCVEDAKGIRDLYEGPELSDMRHVAQEYDGHEKLYHGAKGEEALLSMKTRDGDVYFYKGPRKSEQYYMIQKANGCRQYYAPSTGKGIITYTDWPNGRTDWYAGPEDDRYCSFSVYKDGTRDAWDYSSQKGPQGMSGARRKYSDEPDGSRHFFQYINGKVSWVSEIHFPSGKRRVYPTSTATSYTEFQEEPWEPEWMGKSEGEMLHVEAKKRMAQAWADLDKQDAAREAKEAIDKFAKQNARDKPSSSSSVCNAETVEQPAKEKREIANKKLSPKARGKQKARDPPQMPAARTPSMDDVPHALTHEDLTETEKSAATIGVSPDALKPISWLNEDSSVFPEGLFENAFRELGYTDEQCRELSNVLAMATRGRPHYDNLKTAKDLVQTICNWKPEDPHFSAAAAISLGSVLASCAHQGSSAPAKAHLMETSILMKSAARALEAEWANAMCAGQVTKKSAGQFVQKVLSKRAKKQRRRFKHNMEQAEGMKAAAEASAAAAKREAEEAQREAEQAAVEQLEAERVHAEAQAEAERTRMEAVEARRRDEVASAAEEKAKREAAAEARRLGRREWEEQERSRRKDVEEAQQRAWDLSKRETAATAAAAEKEAAEREAAERKEV